MCVALLFVDVDGWVWLLGVSPGRVHAVAWSFRVLANSHLRVWGDVVMRGGGGVISVEVGGVHAL